MIALDSSVVIHSMKKANRAFFTPEDRRRYAITPIVRMEVLAGASNKDAFESWYYFLSLHPIIEITPAVWDDAALMAFQLKSRGVTVSFQDMLIAAACVAGGHTLWTFDRDFDRIRAVWPQLALHASELT
jgi:predicted nucleic acid-binding protein